VEQQPYYLAYEKRYRAVFEAGAERWGHSPDDQELYNALKEWVTANHLTGKSIIEFACGEGAGGIILSELGCNYHGVDIAPSAVLKAKENLKNYPNARIDILDMVKETAGENYDAALDCMGFHMLVTDQDRTSYLKNAFLSLKPGSPMLFYRESYINGNHKEETVKSAVNSYEEWLNITGSDYETPLPRRVDTGDGDIEVMVPLVPARANDRDGYISELQSAGFSVEKFIEMDISNTILDSASIYVRKLI
jgi:hypothetical protein